jgi:protein SCO1/2
MKRAAFITLTIAVVALCSGVAAYVFAATAPARTGDGSNDLAALSFHPHTGAQLPLSTTFTDETGHEVALQNYFGKTPVILVLEYLRCTSLCGVTLRNIVEALAGTPLRPGRDVQLVAISIDPRDRPADAQAARAKYAALLTTGGGGLHFLTGPAKAARAVADVVGFPYRYDRQLDAYIHPAGFVVATANGVVSRYVEGVAISPPELIKAFADAQENRTPGLITRIILFCHIEGAPLGNLTVPVLAAFMLADIAAGIAAIAVFTVVRRRSS